MNFEIQLQQKRKKWGYTVRISRGESYWTSPFISVGEKSEAAREAGRSVATLVGVINPNANAPELIFEEPNEAP